MNVKNTTRLELLLFLLLFACKLEMVIVQHITCKNDVILLFLLRYRDYRNNFPLNLFFLGAFIFITVSLLRRDHLKTRTLHPNMRVLPHHHLLHRCSFVHTLCISPTCYNPAHKTIQTTYIHGGQIVILVWENVNFIFLIFLNNNWNVNFKLKS